jgi:hypothetical protein
MYFTSKLFYVKLRLLRYCTSYADPGCYSPKPDPDFSLSRYCILDKGSDNNKRRGKPWVGSGIKDLGHGKNL